MNKKNCATLTVAPCLAIRIHEACKQEKLKEGFLWTKTLEFPDKAKITLTCNGGAGGRATVTGEYEGPLEYRKKTIVKLPIGDEDHGGVRSRSTILGDWEAEGHLLQVMVDDDMGMALAKVLDYIDKNIEDTKLVDEYRDTVCTGISAKYTSKERLKNDIAELFF